MIRFKNILLGALVGGLVACGGGSGSGDGGSGDNSGGDGGSTPPPVTNPLERLLVVMADNYVIPGYLNMANEASALRQQVEQFCTLTNAAESDIAPLKLRWQALDAAWQALQPFRFGPVKENSLDLRIQFWPDSNDAVERGVLTLLGSSVPVTLEALQNSNVGGQGLPAVEYLLYPVEAADSLVAATDADKRCEVLTAVAQNLEEMSGDLHQRWRADGGNYRNEFIYTFPQFDTRTDVIEAVLTGYLEGLEILKDQKLLAPLAGGAPGLATVAEWHRSDRSLISARQNVAALRQLFTQGSEYGLDDYLVEEIDHSEINDEMLATIDEVAAALDAIATGMTPALANDADRLQIEQAINRLGHLRTLLLADFSQATDFTLGFNSSDGD